MEVSEFFGRCLDMNGKRSRLTTMWRFQARHLRMVLAWKYWNPKWAYQCDQIRGRPLNLGCAKLGCPKCAHVSYFLQMKNPARVGRAPILCSLLQALCSNFCWCVHVCWDDASTFSRCFKETYLDVTSVTSCYSFRLCFRPFAVFSCHWSLSFAVHDSMTLLMLCSLLSPLPYHHCTFHWSNQSHFILTSYHPSAVCF